MQLDAPTATVISAIVAAGVAGLVALVAQWLNRREESKRQFRLLVIQSAMDTYKHNTQMLLDVSTQYNTGELIGSPDAYISHMLRVMDIATDTGLSCTEAADRIDKLTAPKNPNARNG